MNDFLKLAENLGWSYNVDDTPNERGEVCVELEKYSPQGQDFIATIWFENGNKSDFMDKLYQYYSDFGPDEEASKWIGEDGHGVNGAPYKLSDILQDMEDCKDMLLDLWHEYFFFTMSTKKIVQMRPTKGSYSQEKSRRNPESITTRALYRIIRAVSMALSLMAARSFCRNARKRH